MENKKVKLFEDFLSDFPSLRISALSRAAIISNSQTADVKANGYHSSQNEISKSEGKVRRKQSLQKNEKNIINVPSNSGFPYTSTLDPFMLNAISNKKAEAQRRKDVANEMINKQLSLQRRDEQLREMHNETIAKNLREYSKQKHEQDANLIKRIKEECEIEVQRHEDALQKKRELRLASSEKRKSRLAYETIAIYQKKFRELYEVVVRVFSQIDQKQTGIWEEFHQSLNETVSEFDKLLIKIKDDHANEEDVRISANLLIRMGELQNILFTNLELIRAKEIQEAEQAVPATEPEKTDPATAPAPTTTPATQDEISAASNFKADQENEAAPNFSKLSPFVSERSFTKYTALMTMHRIKENLYKSLQSDPNFMKMKKSCRMAVNSPVNAIAAHSPQHLKDKFDKLFHLLAGNTVIVSSVQFKCTDHPLGKEFCTFILAEKFVSQSDSAISAHPPVAFPIAYIIVSLWRQYPDFGSLFLASMYKECPFLVPYFIPQFEGQSAADYFRVLGYRLTNDGLVEKQDLYLRRETGFVRLFAAVMITSGHGANEGTHPFGIENGWKFLTEILRLDPLPDICATVILEFLQTAGFEMIRVYGNQFFKILITIREQYFLKLNSIDEGGPKARLESFVNKVLQERNIDRPPGILPPNYW